MKEPTSDVRARREESPFSGDNSEDCLWIFVKLPQSPNNFLPHAITKCIKRFGPIKLLDTQLVRILGV